MADMNQQLPEQYVESPSDEEFQDCEEFHDCIEGQSKP
jgi:hypothetical protein